MTRDPTLRESLDDWTTRIICYDFSLSPQQFVSNMNRDSGNQRGDGSSRRSHADPLLTLIAQNWRNIAISAVSGTTRTEALGWDAVCLQESSQIVC